jgi:hypothetical protein
LTLDPSVRELPSSVVKTPAERYCGFAYAATPVS